MQRSVFQTCKGGQRKRRLSCKLPKYCSTSSPRKLMRLPWCGLFSTSSHEICVFWKDISGSRVYYQFLSTLDRTTCVCLGPFSSFYTTISCYNEGKRTLLGKTILLYLIDSLVSSYCRGPGGGSSGFCRVSSSSRNAWWPLQMKTPMLTRTCSLRPS